MNKIFTLVFIILFLTNCSFNSKSKFWTNEEKIQSKTLTENNMNKVFYYDGKQAVIDILNFMLINSKKF